MRSTPPVFARYQPLIDGALGDALAPDPAQARATPLYELLRYHMGWTDAEGRPARAGGGKALRPVICLLACEAVGGDPTPALPAAAAIELLHNFSLLHDDIEDRDETRRGRPTAWTIWGEAQAINGGDGLWAVSSRTLLRAAEAGADPALVLRAMQMLNEASLTMIEGQAIDIGFESRTAVTMDEYLEMIARKTGALIACSYALGALCGGADATTVERWHAYGRLIGRIFQIRDDVLGVWGEEAVTGKSASNDLRRKKQSFPAVYALGSSRRVAAEFAAIYAKPSLDDDDIARAVTLLNEAGAREHAADLAGQTYDEAAAILDTLPLDPTHRRDLDALGRFLLERDR